MPTTSCSVSADNLTVRADGLTRLSVALHDLCQPLTTLQCRLEIATIVGTDAEYREAVAFGMAECQRLARSVTEMRELLRELSVGDAGEGCVSPRG